MRKFVLSAAALFLGLSGLFLAAGAASAEEDWNSVTVVVNEEDWNGTTEEDWNSVNSVQCEEDWNDVCP